MDYLKDGESHHEVDSGCELDASRNTDVKIKLLQFSRLFSEDFRADNYDEADDDNTNDKNDYVDDDPDDNNDDWVWI